MQDVYSKSDIGQHERMNELLFRSDLRVVLGISDSYLRLLICPPKRGVMAEKIRRMRFPEPVYVSGAGIRIWRLSEIDDWVRDIRRRQSELQEGGIGAGLLAAGWPLLEHRWFAFRELVAKDIPGSG